MTFYDLPSGIHPKNFWPRPFSVDLPGGMTLTLIGGSQLEFYAHHPTAFKKPSDSMIVSPLFVLFPLSEQLILLAGLQPCQRTKSFG